MQLALTEDQVLLARSASEFFSESSPVSSLRSLRDGRDPLGYARKRLETMAELGYTGIVFPEDVGGAELGFAELILVTEAMGRCLAPEPLIPSLLLAGRALHHGASPAQKTQWLAPSIAGRQVLALAHTAPKGRYELTRAPFRAERSGSGYRLTGKAVHVWGGFGADAYLVAARTSGGDGDTRGLSLFLVPAQQRGLAVTRQWRLDSHNAAMLQLEGLEVQSDDAVGEVDDGHALLSQVVDEACIGLCGEMLGSMEEALRRTLGYMRERRQFGVAIGSFQALKHRAARLYIEAELTRAAVMAAARALDAAAPDAALLVSVAKARASDAAIWVANEAVQIHAGIGMTDEHEIGFFMKRARAAELTFGDATYHRDRFARLSGY